MKGELFPEGSELPSASMMPSGVAPGKDPAMLEYDEEAVTPEEQEIYTKFVKKAQEYITKSPERVVDQMNNRKKPVFQNVGKTGLMIAQGVAKSASASGAEITPDIMHHGGIQIIELLMELGNAAGIFPFKQESNEYDEAQSMAFMHGNELAAKGVLAGPDAAKRTEEAGNFMAMQIAGEQERGEVDPGFFDGLQNQVATGVNRAINGAG